MLIYWIFDLFRNGLGDIVLADHFWGKVQFAALVEGLSPPQNLDVVVNDVSVTCGTAVEPGTHHGIGVLVEVLRLLGQIGLQLLHDGYQVGRNADSLVQIHCVLQIIDCVVGGTVTQKGS